LAGLIFDVEISVNLVRAASCCATATGFVILKAIEIHFYLVSERIKNKKPHQVGGVASAIVKTNITSMQVIPPKRKRDNNKYGWQTFSSCCNVRDGKSKMQICRIKFWRSPIITPMQNILLPTLLLDHAGVAYKEVAFIVLNRNEVSAVGQVAQGKR
jgi:hypothetical protein